VAPRQLLLLSFIAILSHPLLDTLNTYGVRWLMPFSGRWYYGDTLFIIDPWVWLALGASLYYAIRRQRSKRGEPELPVRLGLGLAGLYVAAMAILGIEARRIVGSEIAGQGALVQGVMAGPVPLDPMRRSFVVEEPEQYRVGTFRWLRRPHIDANETQTFPRGQPAHPAAELAAESTVGRRFLGWARYPTFDVQQVGSDRFLVHVVDLRYARRPGERFGAISIPVTLPTASLPPRDGLSSWPAAPAVAGP
jgi:inner membrane protein